MKSPRRRGEAFLADVRSAPEAGISLWWLGQSGFLLRAGRRHLLIDPYLSDSLTRKYAGTDKPHVRMTAPVIEPAELAFADAVTSSHNHTDHLDAETIGPLLAGHPGMAVVVPEANRAFAAGRLGVDPGRLLGAVAGTPLEVAGFVLHPIPAAHEELEVDAAGRHRFLGYVVEAGNHTVYHSGDTLLWDGLHDELRRFRIDVALLPINGRAPERRVAGNLRGREAAALAREVGAGLVVPCHYDMFEFNTASPDEFVAECERRGQPYRVLENGEGLHMP